MIKFLNYIAQTKLSLAEYPVLTIIYMDTRFKGCCHRTIRGFTENTPFELSASAVLNAINSLIEKGFVEKGFDSNLGMFYIAKNMGKDQDVSFLPNIVNTEVKSKKTRKRKEFVKPERQEVFDYMKTSLQKFFGEKIQDAYVQNVAASFYEYWENLNWSDSRGKIKSVKNRIAFWAKREAHNSGYDIAPYSANKATIEDIVNAIRTIYEPMQFTEDWENERKTALIEQQARAFYAQMTKKNWILYPECKTWEDQLQVFAADPYNTLKHLDPDYIPKNKQEREFRNELYTGSKNCDPVSKDGLKTLALIQRLRKQRQEKENATK